MKKWKQLVVFAMILTMVMGMVSFAAPGETVNVSAKRTVTNSNIPEEPTTSGPSLSTNTVAKSTETPTLAATGDTAELVQKLDLKISFKTDDAKKLPKAQNEGLAKTLKTLLDKGFGKESANDTKGVSKAKLFLFDITVGKNSDQIAGKTIQLELDCSKSNIPPTATKDNLRLLHWTGTTWEMRPIISYTNGKLVAQFNGFSPFCLAYSAVPVAEKYTNEVAQDEVTKPAEIVDKDTGNSDDNNQGSGDNNQGSGDNNQGSGDNNQGSGDNNQGDNNTSEPTRPTKTTDDWHLTYEPMAANKYNVLVLKWDAYVGGKVEVQYSATPENPDSFRRLTTTKKTTYKFKKMEVGVEYGFRIVPKSAPEKASQILYVTREVSEIGATTVTATAKSYNSVSVKWNKIPGVKRYAIYRTNTKTNETEVFVKSGTKLTDKRLTPGIEYRYQVAPIRVTGMKSDIPAESRILSAPACATPELKAITGLKVTAVDSGTLKVSWRRVKGATHYTVDEVVMVDGVETLVRVAGYDQPLNRTQVKFSSLSANSEHTYVVTAHGGSDHTDPVRKAGRTKIAK